MKPRLSFVGIIIFLIYTVGFLWIFRRSSFFNILQSQPQEEDAFSSYSSFPTLLLGGFTFASASLNVASHSAVVLGALDDTFAISILIGVGFDVISNFIYLFFWASLTFTHKMRNDYHQENNDDSSKRIPLSGDASFICLFTSSYIIQQIIHIRALFLADSFNRASSVVRSAWNNIKGDPGYAYLDHLFAYSDLGSHCINLSISFFYLRWQQSLHVGVIFLCVHFILGFGFATKNRKAISLSVDSSKTNSNNNKKDNQKENATIAVDIGGKLICSCNVCKKSKRGSAFCIDTREITLCRLWFLTFQQLSMKFEEINLELVKQK